MSRRDFVGESSELDKKRDLHEKGNYVGVIKRKGTVGRQHGLSLPVCCSLP